MTERGSTRHGARVDDELKAESESLVRGSPVESRAEAWRQKEPPAEGEPDPDALPSRSEVEERSLLAMSLRPSAFPGDRARLVAVAEAEHASPEVMAWLGRLPPDVEFANVQSVWGALGGMHEQREAAQSNGPASPVAAAGEATDGGGAVPAGHDFGLRSLVAIGRSVACEVAGLSFGIAAAVGGGVYESISVVARRLRSLSGSG